MSGISGVAAIAAGGQHSCAITAIDSVCWGDNSGNGQLGNNTNTDSPSPISVVLTCP